MEVKKFTFNPFQENSYVVYSENKDALIIDPGCYQDHEKEELVQFIEQMGLNPVRLLNTHAHIDHVLGNNFVSKKWNLGLELHELDLPTLQSVANYAHLYGFEGYELSPEPVAFLKEGDSIELGNERLDILFCPGHAPGHVAFYSEKDAFIIGGDVLFQGSIGRTDLPGGSFEILEKSIKEKFYTLPDETLVYCGHGPETKIGFEKMNNPFVKG